MQNAGQLSGGALVGLDMLEGLGARDRGEGRLKKRQPADVRGHQQHSLSGSDFVRGGPDHGQRSHRGVRRDDRDSTPGELHGQGSNAGGALEVEAIPRSGPSKLTQDAFLAMQMPGPEELGVGAPLGPGHDQRASLSPLAPRGSPPGMGGNTRGACWTGVG